MHYMRCWLLWPSITSYAAPWTLGNKEATAQLLCSARCEVAQPSARLFFATAAALIPPVRDFVATSMQHASLTC